MKHLSTIILAALFLAAINTSCNKQGKSPSPSGPDTTATIDSSNIHYDETFGADSLGKWVINNQFDDGQMTYLSQIMFAGEDTGFVVDNIYYPTARYRETRDGGQTWLDLQPLTSDRGNRLFLINSDRAASYAPDGGSLNICWRKESVLTNSRISILAWYARAIYETKDFCAPSDSIYYALTKRFDENDNQLHQIRYHSKPDHPNPLYKHTDTVRSIPISEGSAMAFMTEKDGCIATKTGKIYRTTDSGQTWSLQLDAGAYAAFIRMGFYDAVHGWAITGRDFFYKTGDGGLSWQRHALPGSKNYYAAKQLVSVSPSRGFMNAGPEIYETTDGGASWRLSCRFGKVVSAIGFDHKRTVWATSFHQGPDPYSSGLVDISTIIKLEL